MRTHRRRTVCSPLQSICEASVCATGAQMIEFELENWRRRPDLNRGWRFCRFNGSIPDLLKVSLDKSIATL
jgi:hypothetical protein